jgi:hypothetical protein
MPVLLSRAMRPSVCSQLPTTIARLDPCIPCRVQLYAFDVLALDCNDLWRRTTPTHLFQKVVYLPLLRCHTAAFNNVA